MRALGGEVDVAAVILAVRERTARWRFDLVAAGGGWMSRAAADLSGDLRAARQARPSRVVKETLLVIGAGHPVARQEIESFRDAPLHLVLGFNIRATEDSLFKT